MTRFHTKNTSLHDSQKNVTLRFTLKKVSEGFEWRTLRRIQVIKKAESGVA